MATPPSNSLAIKPSKLNLFSAAVPSVANAVGSVYSDFAALQRHRAEQPGPRNETGAPATQLGLFNVNHVYNAPRQEAEGKHGNKTAIVAAVAVTAVATGGLAYYQHCKEVKRLEMKSEAEKEANEKKWIAMQMKLETEKEANERKWTAMDNKLDVIAGQRSQRDTQRRRAQYEDPAEILIEQIEDPDDDMVPVNCA